MIQEEPNQSNAYRTVGIVGSLSLHALLLGLLALSCMTRKDIQPPPFKQVELLEVVPVDATSALPESIPEKEAPPPEPEPVPEKEAPPPEPVKVPEKKTPEPARKKTKTLEERLREAEKKTPKTPSAPQKKLDSSDIASRIRSAQKRSSKSSIHRLDGNPNASLAGKELTAYDSYLVRCLEPVMQRIWDQVGPESLPRPPRNAQVTLVISPAGKVLSVSVSAKSDSATMNERAQQLVGRMQGMSLPSFATTALHSQTPLTFVVYLEYQTRAS